MLVDICFSPALYPYYKTEQSQLVIVIDVFRATSTICNALYNGAEAIIPVASVQKAQEYKKQGFFVGAERNVQKCDFADAGNSPYDYTYEKVEGKTIVFTTTNGTQAIETALDASEIIIGAFCNINTVVDYCLRQQNNVLLLCSGWNNRFNTEDTLFAGAVAEMLLESEKVSVHSDAVTVARQMWQSAKTDMQKHLSCSEHIERLMLNDLQGDVDFCLTLNNAPVLPIYNKKTKQITAHKIS